jgi:hypothetical protein
VADGANGLVILDVTDPAQPAFVGSLVLTGTSQGVAVNAAGTLAGIAMGTDGIKLINVSDPANPTQVGSLAGGDVRDLVFSGDYLLLADYSRSFTAVDVSNPAIPILGSSTPRDNGGLLRDVAVADRFALGADILFVNGVPIINIDLPMSPAPRTFIDFSDFGGDNGNGIAIDAEDVYLAASTRLYIGRYRCGDRDADGLCAADELINGTDPENPDRMATGCSTDLKCATASIRWSPTTRASIRTATASIYWKSTTRDPTRMMPTRTTTVFPMAMRSTSTAPTRWQPIPTEMA